MRKKSEGSNVGRVSAEMFTLYATNHALTARK